MFVLLINKVRVLFCYLNDLVDFHLFDFAVFVLVEMINGIQGLFATKQCMGMTGIVVCGERVSPSH